MAQNKPHTSLDAFLHSWKDPRLQLAQGKTSPSPQRPVAFTCHFRMSMMRIAFQVLEAGRENWCTRQDLNLHAVRQQLLRLSCLPFQH